MFVEQSRLFGGVSVSKTNKVNKTKKLEENILVLLNNDVSLSVFVTVHCSTHLFGTLHAK